jgi:hypothetical protein
MQVIQIIGLVNGGATAFDGQYLKEFDASRDGVEPISGRVMMCRLVTTPDISEAKVFADVIEAHRLWVTVDEREPVRPDGKPNRPLTAFTIRVESA